MNDDDLTCMRFCVNTWFCRRAAIVTNVKSFWMFLHEIKNCSA